MLLVVDLAKLLLALLLRGVDDVVVLVVWFLLCNKGLGVDDRECLELPPPPPLNTEHK